ncbi:type II toxin-antitoxin system PemK/MazF family toxin [Paenibacillus sp. BAC0078]
MEGSNTKPTLAIKRGEVFFADLSPVVGSEQGGVRPVVVVSNDITNKFSPTITILPVTKQIRKAKLPTHVEVSIDDDKCVILAEQVRTIDKQRLLDKITTLDATITKGIDYAIQVNTGLIRF